MKTGHFTSDNEPDVIINATHTIQGLSEYGEFIIFWE
jgi:hypothetical protein